MPAAEQLSGSRGDAERQSRILNRTLDRMPTEGVQVLRMLYLDGLTMAEIAQALEVPLETVKSRVRRALQAMRKQLREEP
jgi:RNA polymerase sigma-70 factor (ECF subfamily)